LAKGGWRVLNYRTNPSAAAHCRLQALHRLMFLPAGIAFNRVWPHCHWTWMYRLLPKAITGFKVREVFPPFRFSQPFPTVRMVEQCALAAQPFHMTTAC
jgi:hypothetical protein